MGSTMLFMRHVGRCFVTGTERIGAFSQHNLLVGSAVVGMLVFTPLAGGIVAVALGSAELLIPTILLAAMVLFVVFAVGSYALAPALVGALNLDVRCTTIGLCDPPDEVWASHRASSSAMFPPKVRVWQVGNMLILNRGPERVVLRIRIRIKGTVKRADAWSSPDGTEFVWASGVCVRDWVGMRLYVEAGDLPHLPTEIALDEKEHIHGHAEFVMDTEYLDSNYTDWRDDFGEITIEDLLTGRSSVHEQTDWYAL